MNKYPEMSQLSFLDLIAPFDTCFYFDSYTYDWFRMCLHISSDSIFGPVLVQFVHVHTWMMFCNKTR